MIKTTKKIIIDKINNKEWMQNMLVELVGDITMLACAIVIGAFIKFVLYQ